MSSTLWLILATGIAMAGHDLVATASTYFVAKDRRKLAASFDCASDTFGLVSLGSPLAVFALHGVSIWSGFALVSMWAGSWTGTVSGLALAERLNLRMGCETV